MPHKFSMIQPDIITDLLQGAQGLTNSILLWLILTIDVAAYFLLLGWNYRY